MQIEEAVAELFQVFHRTYQELQRVAKGIVQNIINFLYTGEMGGEDGRGRGMGGEWGPWREGGRDGRRGGTEEREGGVKGVVGGWEVPRQIIRSRHVPPPLSLLF